MRTRYRYRDGRVVDDDGIPMLNQGERALPPQAPFTVSDCQPHLRSMVTGKYHDSKSAMRQEYRQYGVTEVGTEKQKRGRDWIDERAKRKKQRAEIKAALHRAHSRMGYGAV